MLKKSNIPLTSLQSSLISTVYQWYANQSSISAGERAFLSSIANISQTYPNETDIRVLWGLSLLNVAFDREFEGQMEPKPMTQAREVLETALDMEPNHPGALHYLIHAYDVDQVNIAEIASDYAILYNKTVVTLSHAQHMPAHIWMRTGKNNFCNPLFLKIFSNTKIQTKVFIYRLIYEIRCMAFCCISRYISDSS